MELGEACAVYLDDRVKDERWVTRNTESTTGATHTGLDTPVAENAEIRTNVLLFLGIFKKVYLSNSRKSFGQQLTELNVTCRPTSNPLFAIVSIAVSGSSEPLWQSSTSQPTAPLTAPPTFNAKVGRFLRFSSESDDFCALELLARFSANLKIQTEVNLAVPVAFLRFVENDDDCGNSTGSKAKDHHDQVVTEGTENDLSFVNRCICRCLDAGAVDVLTTPLKAPRLQGLSVRAYKIFKTARKQQWLDTAAGRPKKHSWVGATDHQPYSYLRETMVTKLMKRICNPDEELDDYQSDLHILDQRKRLVEVEIGKWDFSAHDFSEDELVHAGTIMLEHALQMPELEPWRISSEELHSFLLATRVTYNGFVLYHNFRHAIDVMQSLFYLLVSIGVLLPYPNGTTQRAARSPMASLLTPFDALTLLITAIGHDVGHPGVNNVFLVKLNAPLAQLYNDISVLESFHCAAYSQLLRSYWPSVFADKKLRKLMISSILATDMGIHFNFMEGLGKLQEKYHETDSTEGWKAQEIETDRVLLCGILIKCADISNVARPWNIAKRWTNVLQEEFAQQGKMEKTIGMETALFGGPPELGNIPKLAKGQVDFMKIFALPLFDGIADLIPEIAFTTVEIRRNKSIWREIMNREVQSEESLEKLIQDTPPVVQSHTSTPPLDLRNLKLSESPPEDPPPNTHKTPPATWNLPPVLNQIPLNKEMQCGIDKTFKADKGCQTKIDSPTASPSPLVISTSASGHTDLVADENQVSNPRRFQCHRPFQRSSGRATTITAVNRHSEITSGTRTQSTSTYTNNTVMTPISSTTQASSVISAGSSDDGHDYVRNELERNKESALPRSCSESLADQDVGGSSRATPVGISVESGRPSRLHPYHSDVEDEKTSHFMATFFDKSFGHHAQGNGFTITNPTSSTSVNNYLPANSSHSSNHDFPPLPHHIQDSNGNTNRTVPRRRSRLRLAFWRRNRDLTSSDRDL
ncbi:hypothetical protein AJ78_07541 [Emergomyces pasteurianus Ep9510]|uniref:Phosphodiesterase n=1 Tax=Emergomyces pasteurianus Ep9510 TaxID=1447872 RepID=A0A1J9Q694_9EURO|nr:hypothetical protein AJ78_07541 [Emergomyces pasteurianus Ep9510]